MTELEKVISSSLNLFCFLNIWNEPQSEYRVNIKPVMISEHSKSGSAIINGMNVNMPVMNEPFYLYSISKDCFRNAFALPPMSWMRADTLCNDHDILLQVYTEQGRMCSTGECYIMLFANEDNYIVAVSKKMLSKLCPHNKSDKIYITVYKDSDIPNKMTVYPYKVPGNDINGTYRINIVDKISTINDPSRVIIYINGYQATLDSYTKLEYGDFIDIIHDENILFDYTIDLTDNDQYRMFYSTMDKMSKLLVHTPKHLNPNNDVLTHNTCDFYVQRKKPEKYATEGLYIHRTADVSISQITHQDFSIPMFVIDAHRDYLKTQEVTIRVVVRKHDKNNVLLRDKNYIDLLYTQKDNVIVDCMMGKINNSPSFWRAAILESSVYVKMMFSIPVDITAANMYEYVEGLGYYHTISLICQRVISTYITDLWGNILVCPKPYLFADREIYPMIYHNGTKIPASRLSVTNSPQKGFTVEFLDNAYHPGDALDIEMFLDGSRQIYDFTVTESNRELIVSYSEYSLYEEQSTGILIDGVVGSFNKQYKKITELTNVVAVRKESNGYLKFTFSLDSIGKTFLIQNKYCVRPLNVTSIVQSQINTGKTIVINLETMTDGSRLVPICEIGSTQLFINGKYLIKNLDYYLATITHENAIIANQIVVQNMSYLSNDNNQVELIVTSAEVEDQSFGFLRNDTIVYSGSKKLALWFNNISTAHIDGKIELELDNQSSHINVPKNKYRQGAPYEICTNIPKVVKDFIDSYHTNDDYERIQELNKYFYDVEYIPDGIVILPYSHKIYSSYINRIINEVVNGVAELSYDPDFNRLDNQLKKYHYLKKYDLVFNDESIIDLTYVDIFPTYSEYGSVSVETRKLVHAIVKLLLPEDNFSSGEIPNVN